MNIGARIQLRAEYQDHIEYYSGLQVLPTAHPPSLKNPVNVVPDTAQDGWHKKDSKRKKRRARRDMKQVIERTLRQSGRPVMVRHALYPTPGAINSQ